MTLPRYVYMLDFRGMVIRSRTRDIAVLYIPVYFKIGLIDNQVEIQNFTHGTFIAKGLERKGVRFFKLELIPVESSDILV